MIYQLYYKHYFIATVEHTYSDFPGLSGYYQLADFGESNRDTKMIREYINHSIQSSKYYLDNEAHNKRAAELAQDEWKYQELYEGREWQLKAEHGEIVPILIPVFGENQEMGWRCA